MQAWRLYPLWSLEFNLELGRVRSSRALKPQDNRHYFKLPQDKGEELLTNTTPSNSSIHSLSRSLAHIEALRMKLNSKLGSLERWPECALDISFKTCRRGDNTDQCRCEYYSRNIFFFFPLSLSFPWSTITVAIRLQACGSGGMVEHQLQTERMQVEATGNAWWFSPVFD